MLKETKVSSSNIFDGSLLHVRKDNITLPNGQPATREYIEHLGAVAIVAIDDENNVIMERQYRYPISSIISEIPAGKLDYKGEDVLSAAKRELQEETGVTAEKWTSLGVYVPTPAYSDEVIHLFLAQQLQFGKRHLDEDEFINWKPMPLNEVVKQIENGQIIDGKTQSAILKAKLFLEK